MTVNADIFIVALEISTSSFRRLKNIYVVFSKFVVFIVLTFHSSTPQRYILFKDRPKKHPRYIFVAPFKAIDIHFMIVYAVCTKQKPTPFYYNLKLANNNNSLDFVFNNYKTKGFAARI